MVRSLSVLLLLIACTVPLSASAAGQDLTFTPVVIDDKGQARDILKETITLTNTSNHKLSLYPSVNNVERVDGTQDFAPARGSADLAASLANWIELSRGVIELSPGEQREVPFIIHINGNAIPDTYHAQISFTEGTTRAEAEAKPALGLVTVNLEVQADVKEIMQLDRFSTSKFYLAGDDIRFDYNLENIGNQALTPHGEIRVYDKTGQEVASVDVNKEGKAVSPEQLAQLASVWTGAEGFGQYKALLTVYYGKSQTASVQDTIFFWIVPWKQLIGLFVAGLLGVIFFAFYFHRWLERKHGYVHTGVPFAPEPKVLEKKPAAPSMLKRIPFLMLAVPVAAVRTVAGGFGKLKRGERRLPARAAEPTAEAVASAPAPVAAAEPVHVPEPHPVSAPAAPVYAAPAASASGTIDLKNLRTAPPEHIVSDAHVIDLKRSR